MSEPYVLGGQEDDAPAHVREAAAREYLLRFAVMTQKSGRTEIRYFRNPQDWGEVIKLTPRERDDLVLALNGAGFHAVYRDDEPDLQLVFEFGMKQGVAA